MAIASAAPLDLGSLLGSVGSIVSPVVGTVTGLVDGLIGDVDAILSALTPEVSKLLSKLTSILNLSSSGNPLVAVQSLITKLESVLEQLTGSVGSGLPIASGVSGDVNEILSTLTSILNIPVGTDVATFLNQLIASLSQFLSEVLNAVSGLLTTLLGDLTQVPLLNGLLADIQLAGLVGNLIGVLQQIVAALKTVQV